MPRPAAHDPDAILDAARTLVLERGPRGATVSAIATASGAPTGSLYHRFGSRDGIVTAVWERAVRRAQGPWLEAMRRGDGVGAALATVDLVAEHPADGRLLLSLRLEDLLDGDAPPDLESVNAAARAEVAAYARRTGLDPQRVAMATVDLPLGTLRRHRGPLPAAVRATLAAAVADLLRPPTEEETP